MKKITEVDKFSEEGNVKYDSCWFLNWIVYPCECLLLCKKIEYECFVWEHKSLHLMCSNWKLCLKTDFTKKRRHVWSALGARIPLIIFVANPPKNCLLCK